jgi:transcriptional regulator with XRE-family HTH domain
LKGRPLGRPFFFGGIKAMFSWDLLNERLRVWREQQGLSIDEIADAAAVSIQDVHDWETGRAEPSPNLRYRLSEMMRGDASEQLSLRKVFVNGLRSYVALIDVDDTRLIAASQGLRCLWPEVAGAVGQPFLDQMTP